MPSRTGRDAEPTAGVIDSQSVKADAVVGSDSRGFDGGKLINGRKRHVVVDTLGLLLGVMVTAADTGDRATAQVLLERVADAHHRLALVWADGGYTGPSSSTAWPRSPWSWRSSNAATTCAASWSCPSDGSSSASSPT
ncbi:transposase [Streptomyces sp. NPDC054771]